LIERKLDQGIVFGRSDQNHRTVNRKAFNLNAGLARLDGSRHQSAPRMHLLFSQLTRLADVGGLRDGTANVPRFETGDHAFGRWTVEHLPMTSVTS